MSCTALFSNIPLIFVKVYFLECKMWQRIRPVTTLLWDFIASVTKELYLEPICIIEKAICVGCMNLFNPLNPELNPICYLLALLAQNFLHVSRIRVKSLTLRLLMAYIYGAHILDVSRSHTTTHHSR